MESGADSLALHEAPDEDDEDDYEDQGGGNQLLGFMFGNVDCAGDLDADYLDEDLHWKSSVEELKDILNLFWRGLKGFSRRFPALQAKGHPQAQNFINKSIELYEELSIICENDYATGSYSRGSSDPLSVNHESSSEDVYRPSLDDSIRNENASEENTENSVEASLESSERPKQPKGKDRCAREFEDELKDLAANISRIAD